MEVSKVNSPSFKAIHIDQSAEKYLRKNISEDELRFIKRLMTKNKTLETNVLYKMEADETTGNKTFKAIVGDKTYVKSKSSSTFGFLDNIIKDIKNGKI